MNFKTITNEPCCQGGIRRIVLDEKIAVKIGEGVTFSIPTGVLAPNTRLKLFVGFEHTCPNELQAALNGKACSDADFGMDSYLYLHDPAFKYYTVATYSTTPGDKDAQELTITGNPDGIIKYLELKIQG